jgi:hypothetical protein
MPVSRSLVRVLLRVTVAFGIVALTLTEVKWPNRVWANYVALALIAACLALVGLLYRAGAPEVAALRILSPRWTSVGTGVLIMCAVLPWTALVGLAVRYGILPNDSASGFVLLVPCAIFIAAGCYVAVKGFIRSR